MLNSCNFIGNLGQDPEVKTTQAGKKIVNFSIAVTEKWKNAQGERQERTEWVRVNCFQDGLCGVIENYVKKGSKVYISGKMNTRSWDDQSGQKKYATEINLQNLVMLDGANGQSGNQGGGQSQGGQGSQGGGYNDDMGDIPF